MRSLLDRYLIKFGTFPKKIEMLSYEDEIYQNLMEKALKTGKPISYYDLDVALEDTKLDLVLPSDEDIYDKAIREKIGG